MKRIAVASVCLLLATIASRATPAQALSESYHYKWPYLWSTSAAITTYPFSGVHGCPRDATHECVAAYDLVIASGSVAAASEGTAFVQGGFQPDQCGPSGYGNYVDLDGARYAHLNSFAPSVVTGAHLLQGDQIGTQGGTGHVEPCDPPNNIGRHLHWEFLSGVVPTIDGGSAASSNSIIGEYSTSGSTLRGYYQTHGSWNSIGWTYKHCPGTCTLDMTANRTWGRMQDFQHDPDGYGGTFDTIHVPTWDQTRAYLVDSVFWQAWAVGGPDHNGVVRPIGMAKSERGACPPGSSAACLWYQKFDLGFVWMDVYTGRNTVFCADMNGDQMVNGLELNILGKQFLKPPVPPAVEMEGQDYVINALDLNVLGSDFLHDCHIY